MAVARKRGDKIARHNTATQTSRQRLVLSYDKAAQSGDTGPASLASGMSVGCGASGMSVGRGAYEARVIIYRAANDIHHSFDLPFRQVRIDRQGQNFGCGTLRDRQSRPF
jgi:hypothetical protein